MKKLEKLRNEVVNKFNAKLDESVKDWSKILDEKSDDKDLNKDLIADYKYYSKKSFDKDMDWDEVDRVAYIYQDNK